MKLLWISLGVSILLFLVSCARFAITEQKGQIAITEQKGQIAITEQSAPVVWEKNAVNILIDIQV